MRLGGRGAIIAGSSGFSLTGSGELQGMFGLGGMTAILGPWHIDVAAHSQTPPRVPHLPLETTISLQALGRVAEGIYRLRGYAELNNAAVCAFWKRRWSPYESYFIHILV